MLIKIMISKLMKSIDWWKTNQAKSLMEIQIFLEVNKTKSKCKLTNSNSKKSKIKLTNLKDRLLSWLETSKDKKSNTKTLRITFKESSKPWVRRSIVWKKTNKSLRKQMSFWKKVWKSKEEPIWTQWILTLPDKLIVAIKMQMPIKKKSWLIKKRLRSWKARLRDWELKVWKLLMNLINQTKRF